MTGSENVYKLHEQLGISMTENVTVVRYNKELERTLQLIADLKRRSKSIGINSLGSSCNQELLFINHFKNMLEVAEVITKGALQRNESRGAHYKPDYPERNDPDWLKTTMAKYTPAGVELSYADVDIHLIKPRARVYNVDKQKSAE